MPLVACPVLASQKGHIAMSAPSRSLQTGSLQQTDCCTQEVKAGQKDALEAAEEAMAPLRPHAGLAKGQSPSSIQEPQIMHHRLQWQSAKQEVKAGQKDALEAAEEAIGSAQRELQEERERSTRLMEAAQAGQLSGQTPGPPMQLPALNRERLQHASSW